MRLKSNKHTEEKINKKHEQVISYLKKYTKHKYAKLVNRGNAAIFCALSIVKKNNPKPFILIPDQGGWISFKTYPKFLGFEVRSVKTNRGGRDVIDLEKKAESGAAFILTSFAGYFAEQPMKYISRICKKAKCILIEDASGALGDDDLCDGAYSDIIVGSFGRWKPVNIGYGGFISFSKKEYSDNDAFFLTNYFPEYDLLIKELGNIPTKLKVMLSFADTMKKDISKEGIRILHPDKRGLNVVAKYMNEVEKKQIIDYCEKKKYDFVVCPKYIRLEEDAVSIELKRISADMKHGKKSGKKR